MKTRYALHALRELARHDGRLDARTLAMRAMAPPRFLESILVELRDAGFVDSTRGARGGHALARPAEAIRLGEVIRALDGPLAALPCASVSAYRPCAGCPDPATCALRAVLREARDAVAGVLDARTLREFAAGPAAIDASPHAADDADVAAEHDPAVPHGATP